MKVIVTVCAPRDISKNELLEAELTLTSEGFIVLLPPLCEVDEETFFISQLNKVKLSQVLYVLTTGNYISPQVASIIEYAVERGLEVRFSNVCYIDRQIRNDQVASMKPMSTSYDPSYSSGRYPISK